MVTKVEQVMGLEEAGLVEDLRLELLEVTGWLEVEVRSVGKRGRTHCIAKKSWGEE